MIDIISKEKTIRIKAFQTNDYELVRNFVLSCHNDLVNADYFIVDDINTALPAILCSSGYVYGAYYGDELIAVHGVNLSKENYIQIFQQLPSYITDKPLAEMGWTMIKKSFQGHGIATFLISELEKIVPKTYDLIATVHPQNVAALKAYINNGFYGVALNDYYSKPRVFLFKRTRTRIRYDEEISMVLLKEMCSDHFIDKNMLIGILKKNGIYYGQFAKMLEP